MPSPLRGMRQTSPPWHIAMPSGGGIHSINAKFLVPVWTVAMTGAAALGYVLGNRSAKADASEETPPAGDQVDLSERIANFQNDNVSYSDDGLTFGDHYGAATIVVGGADHGVTYNHSSIGVLHKDLGADVRNIIGTPFDDSITSSDEVNQGNYFEGGKGDDLLEGGGGDDILVGGEGDDVLRGGLHDDVLIGDSGSDTLEGGAGDDVLSGGEGDDTLEGGAGDDALSGGEGADRLDGGAGTDTAVYSESNSGVTVDLSAGTGKGGDAEGDTLTSVENVIGS